MIVFLIMLYNHNLSVSLTDSNIIFSAEKHLKSSESDVDSTAENAGFYFQLFKNLKERRCSFWSVRDLWSDLGYSSNTSKTWTAVLLVGLLAFFLNFLF